MTDKNTPSPQPNVNDDEIDLLALAKTLWLKRKTIVAIIGVFVVLGLAVALLSPKEFTANSVFVPQVSDQNRAGGSLGGLASLAGINLGGMGGGSEIPPSLYPKIVSSVNFRLAILDAPLSVDGLDKPVTYRHYYDSIHDPGVLSYIKKFTVGLPGLLLKSLRGDSDEVVKDANDQLIRVSQEDFEHFKRMDAQISVTPNDKEGFVSLSFVLPEPIMAAQMARFAQDLLQEQVIAYKISNAQEQLKFTEERFEEKKKEFEEIQSRLANFRDRNQNIASAAVLNQQQRLEAEYNFAFSIYTELAKQLEQARIQVAKDTPVFSVIQPVTVPVEKSAPKRPLILVIFIILGGIMAIGYVFGVEFFKGVKEQWVKV